MMGRKRRKNKGLPPYVYIDRGKQRKDGSWPPVKYFIESPLGDDIRKRKRIILGNSEVEMYKNYVALIERPRTIKNFPELIDNYLQEVAAKKCEGTFNHEAIKAKFLKAFFKEFSPDEITAQDIYEYMDIRSQKEKIEQVVNGKRQVIFKGGHVAANRERSLLSNIFNFAIRKGLVKDNPCRHVKPFKERSRDRYPEDWELKAIYSEASPILQCLLDFAYLTGQRRGDILFITESQITDEGIHIVQSKTKKKTNTKLLIEWSESLRGCVNRARKLRGIVRSMYLFTKEDGQPYSIQGFKSMYKRAMQKALQKGTLKESFNFHDIRAKTYSDDEDAQEKIKRAGHVDAKMGKVYDRKVKKVKPLK